MKNKHKEIRDLFLMHDIPYDDIDEEIRETIYLLNFEHGLKTKYCCSGHRDDDRFYIMFHEEVEDEKMERFINQILAIYPLENISKVKFYFYVRGIRSNKNRRSLLKNWMFESNIYPHKIRINLINQFNRSLKKLSRV